VQVLSEALKLYGTEITPIKPIATPETTKLFEKEYDSLEAFIFNSSTHWFALRKIDGIWFNLNSTNSFPGPEIVSDFYLTAFIQGTESIGYTNFLVKKLPPLPALDSGVYDKIQPFQRLVTIEEIILAKESKKKEKDSKEEKKKEDEEEKNKFKAFTGKGTVLNESKNTNVPQGFEDEDMKAAYELSLQEFIKDVNDHLPPEPQNDPNAYNIMFKFGDQSFSRFFNEIDKVADLMNYVKAQVKTFSDVELFESFPRKIYEDAYLSLKEAGLSKNQYLMVKIIN
jgi:hypothetical protein